MLVKRSKQTQIKKSDREKCIMVYSRVRPVLKYYTKYLEDGRTWLQKKTQTKLTNAKRNIKYSAGKEQQKFSEIEKYTEGRNVQK